MNLYENFHKKTSVQKRIVTKNNFTYKIILLVLEKYIKPKSKILDYGSGAGTIALFLTQQGHEVTGVDVSKKAINSSKKTGEKLNLKTKFLLSNEYKISKHDYCLLLEVIEHVKDEDKLLKLLHKSLKKNGILILSTPSINAPLYKLGLTKSFDKEVGHLRRYSKKDLQKLLTKNNFKIIKTIPNEGIVRNSLFLLKPLGFLTKFVKGPLVNIVTVIDNLSMNFFGESDFIIIAKRK